MIDVQKDAAAPGGASGPGEAGVAARLWERLARLLGEIDSRFRRSLPPENDEPLSLRATWREAGVFRFLVLLQVLVLGCRMVLVPLVMKDYDIFFHLAQGRYQELMGRLPTDAWFSFLEPRPYLDYYWLFQRLVYELWTSFGPSGLFMLRAVVVASTLLLLIYFLFGRRQSPAGVFAGLLVLTLVGSRLAESLVVIRPFVFSYLFLLAVLFILELRSRWAFLLPIIGVLWMNLHGIEHPVMIAVVLAYLGDEFLVFCRRRVLSPDSRRRTLGLLLTLPTLLLTPYGFELVMLPFRSTALSSLYILEMKKPTVSSLFSLTLGPEAPYDSYGLALIVFLLAVASGVRLLQRRSLRPAHLVLMVAGTWLALQADRFSAEFVLLLMPILAQGAFFDFRRRISPLATLTAAGLVAVLTYDTAKAWVHESRSAYPMAFHGFPYLSSRFLQEQAEPGARVYNSASYGGFYMWELGDRHRIMMDLEVTAIFHDEDYFLNRTAMLDANAFRAFVERYRPDYLAVGHDEARASPFLRSSEDFVPVAFDDSVVLLVQRHLHPELAEKWRLRALDPFRAKLDNSYRLSVEAAVEARRLYELEPRGLRLPALLAQEAISRGDAAAAERYVDTMLEVVPENGDTWVLASQVAMLREDLEAAATALEKGLMRTDVGNRENQHLVLARLRYRLGDPESALEHLRKRGPFFERIPLEDLAMEVELLEKLGSPEEAAAARRVLELRRGSGFP